MICCTPEILAGGSNEDRSNFGAYLSCPLIALTYGAAQNGENWGDFVVDAETFDVIFFHNLTLTRQHIHCDVSNKR